MTRNWVIPAILIAVASFALVLVAGARASYTDARLNAVASAVAGHPVVVQCASGAMEWADTERAASLPFEADGFTYIGRDNIVRLSPGICETLEEDFRYGPTAVGDLANGRAIKVLLHEASHQAGIADEGAADCRALSLVKTYAPSFGYARTVKITMYVAVNKIVAGGQQAYVRQTKTVPNPALARLYSAALAWHRLLPPSYQGGC